MIIQYETELSDRPLINSDLKTNFTLKIKTAQGPKILFFVIHYSVFQLNYSKLLFRYICHTQGKLEAEVLFPKYMEMLANLREMSDIMQHKTIKNFTPFPTVDQEIKSLIR